MNTLIEHLKETTSLPTTKTDAEHVSPRAPISPKPSHCCQLQSAVQNNVENARVEEDVDDINACFSYSFTPNNAKRKSRELMVVGSYFVEFMHGTVTDEADFKDEKEVGRRNSDHDKKMPGILKKNTRTSIRH